MGRMFMTDLLKSRLNGEDFTLFNQEDINKAFEDIRHLSYNQSMQLSGNGHGLSITPLQAGHMVGSTIWKIVKDNDEDIIYAVDYNHKKEHLNGCALDTLSRPSLVITDAYNALNRQVRMKERDQRLMNCIIDTLCGGGNILIACDTAGRVLELAYMLDYVWRKQESGLSAYSLALVSNVASNMIEVAKSTIEWVSEKIQRMLA
ncbi:Cleavage and polyadenylation specificity factor subunit 2, partial [Fragariocoptes setiger]